MTIVGVAVGPCNPREPERVLEALVPAQAPSSQWADAEGDAEGVEGARRAGSTRAWVIDAEWPMPTIDGERDYGTGPTKQWRPAASDIIPCASGANVVSATGFTPTNSHCRSASRSSGAIPHGR